MFKLYISNKDEYPRDKVELNNDAFFNHYFDKEKLIINSKMAEVIKHIDETDYDASTNTIKSKFNDASLSPKDLSTGCKTVLNIMAFPNKMFSLDFCGDNAIHELLDLSNELSDGSAFTKFYLSMPLENKEVNIQVINMDTGKKEHVTNTGQLFEVLGSYFLG